MSVSQELLDKDLWKRREIVKSEGRWTVEGRPNVIPEILSIEKPSNIPGKSYVAVMVTVPPGTATPPHTHNGAAVYGQVIKGRVISQMIHTHKNTKPDGTVETVEHDSGVGVYGPGDIWYEAPGCHHVRAESGGDEEAKFFANFIIDTEKLEAVEHPGMALTILDIDAEQSQKL